MKTIVYWSMKTSNCIICIVVLFLSFSFGCGSEEVFNEIGNHKDGEKHGKWISYFEDGQIWHEGNYKDGKEHGEFIYFGYGNYNILHKVKSEGYKDGKLNGKIIHFHVNGEKNSIVNYKDGEKNGKNIFYDKDGNIYWSGNFQDGVLIDGGFIKSDKPFDLY